MKADVLKLAAAAVAAEELMFMCRRHGINAIVYNDDGPLDLELIPHSFSRCLSSFAFMHTVKLKS